MSPSTRRVEFEVAARRGVHRDRAVAGLDRDRGQVRQALLLGFLDVAEQRARRRRSPAAVVDAEAGRSCRPKNCSSCRRPLSASNSHGARRRRPLRVDTDVGQPSSSASSSSAGSRRASSASSASSSGDFVDQEAAAGEVGPGQAVTAASARHRHQQRVAALVEQRLVGHRARGDDAHHLALDQALGQRRDRRSARRSPPIRRARPAAPGSLRRHGAARRPSGSAAPADAPRWVRVMSSSRAALRASS